MNNLLVLYRINAAISDFFLNENSLIDNESSVVNRKLYQMNFIFKPKVNFGIMPMPTNKLDNKTYLPAAGRVEIRLYC